MILGSWRNVRLLPRPERLPDAERLRLSPTRTGLDSESTFDFRLCLRLSTFDTDSPGKIFPGIFFFPAGKAALEDPPGRPGAGGRAGRGRRSSIVYMYALVPFVYMYTGIQAPFTLCNIVFSCLISCFHIAKHDNILQYALFIKIKAFTAFS